MTLAEEPFCEQMFQIAAAMDHSNQVNAVLQREVVAGNRRMPCSFFRTRKMLPLSGWLESRLN